MSMCVALVAPTSSMHPIILRDAKRLSISVGGSVKLASPSAFDAPLIDPAFMQTPSDLAILTEAVKAAHRFASAPMWRDFIIGPFAGAVNTTTDADIHAYIRSMATTFRHPMGTARMGSAHDSTGVVGPDLRVRNVIGLRIVDASIFVRYAHRASEYLRAHIPLSLTSLVPICRLLCTLSLSVRPIWSKRSMASRCLTSCALGDTAWSYCASRFF